MRRALVIALSVLSCTFVSLGTVRADEFAKRNNEGNQLVKKGQLDQALQRYQEAKVERPDRPEVDYNIGNVYHLEGKLDSAAQQYQNALTTLKGPVAPNASYNLGNTYYRLQKYGPAIEAYKQALIDNPKDPDSKHNLELALRRLQADSTKQQQKQQNQQNKSDSTQQKQDQKKNDQQNQQKKDSTQQNQQSPKDKQPDSTQGQPPPSDQDKPQSGDQKKQQQSRQQVGMTKEDAKRILDALKNDELKVQRLRAQKTAQETNVKKDW